jgi:hypothetical protein
MPHETSLRLAEIMDMLHEQWSTGINNAA